ncbi:MAG TPA: TIGR03435 family protein [Vicinamibacterales bacterium]|jgi:uncharacterized protein (TIGR03435 family)|nr:TIGR03435 family protein [Vicinamibacterales bacterium]
MRVDHRSGVAAVVVSCVVALLSPTPRVNAQAPAQEPRFEVAVVKVNDSGEPRVAGGFQPGGRYSVTNYPLRALIAAAYLRPQVNPDFLIAGGPDWIDKARFNIEAKAAAEFPAGPDGPNAPRRVMLQQLLADRFGLRVHHESRQGQLFALLRVRDDRLGSRLRPSQIDCGPSAPAPERCVPRIAPGSLTLTGTSLTALVNLLPRFVDHVVIDATGLSGRFDLDLTWTPGPTEWVPPSSGAGVAAGDDGSSLTTALREQLGLRLQAQTGPVDVLVIEAATWPTGN